MRKYLFVSILGVFLSHAEDLDRVMKAARLHVQSLESSVPNFVCKEQILSQRFDHSKLKKETRADAILTTTRTFKNGFGNFSETRTEMRINGHRSKRTEIDGPFVWENGPAYGGLHFLFNLDKAAECLEYKLIGTVQWEGKDALLIETQPSRRAASGGNCGGLNPDSADKIWLDLKSSNVIRIESHNPPATEVPGGVITLTVDYAPAAFDGVEYWLPSHVISRLDFPGGPQYFRYEVFFTEYHKYGAESSFHIDPDR